MEYSQIVSQKINNHILKITDETSCTEAEQDLIAFVREYLSSIPNSVHSEEDWIGQLLKYQEDDLYVPYIGNAITFCWHVNPIRLLSLANRDHFPLLFPFFEHSVSIVPQMDSSVFFSLLEEIYGKLDHNYLKTRVAVSIASYFQDKPIEHICSFYRETYINCSEAKTWLIPFVAKHYAAIGPTQFQNSVVQFLQSDKNGFLVLFGIIILHNNISKFLAMFSKYVI